MIDEMFNEQLKVTSEDLEFYTNRSTSANLMGLKQFLISIHKDTRSRSIKVQARLMGAALRVIEKRINEHNKHHVI